MKERIFTENGKSFPKQGSDLEFINTDDKAIERLNRIFKLQKAAFLNNPYPSAEERIALMQRVEPMLRKHRKAILEALDADFNGHSPQGGDLLEILGMFDRAKYNIANVKKWMKPIPKQGNPVTLGSSKAYLKYHPKGVIGNMVSWNFPFDIGLGPTLDALAAGNRVIIKPSDLSPACGQVLQEMISETFDEDTVSVVNGQLGLAKYFATRPWDHLLYTGSGVVGKQVMKAAAENLVPVTLELGGKCPAILDQSGVTDANIAEIAGVKVVKRGQMCVTVDYCLVPDTHLEEFTNKMVATFQQHFSEGNGVAHACGIITQRHLTRLNGLVDEAKAGGTKVIQIGQDVQGDNRNMPFYIVVNPSDDLRLMQDEIFGPILPIKPYQHVQEVIDYVNQGDQPLGLYIYSQQQEFVDTITANTRSGGVAVNVCALQAAQPSLPFGGIGSSGMGVHHGEEGFKEFSNPRGYFVRGKGGTIDQITPPYDKATDELIEHVAYGRVKDQLKFALKTLPKNLIKRFVR